MVSRSVPKGLLWSVGGTAGGSPPWSGSRRWISRMIEACSDAGILGVHAGVDAAAPARADLLAEAISTAEHPPELLVVVQPRAENPRGVRELGGLRPSDRGRSDRPARTLLEILFEPAAADHGRPPQLLGQGAADTPVPEGWGFGFAAPPTSTSMARALKERPDWVRFPYHMLSSPAADELLGMARSAGVPVIASDPFAGGRLDGSHLRGSPLETPGRPAPADWAAVRRAWAPVLGLGFLTSGRARSLPQAALQYVLGTPGVAGVLVPAPEPSALVEAGAALRLPPVGPGDRARIAEIRGVRTDPPGSAAGRELK
jgi:aldo/keto reductase family protein